MTLKFSLCLTVFVALVAASAHAQDDASAASAIMKSPAQMNLTYYDESLYPPIKLSPENSELVRLDKPAASVIVGNPAHLSVLIESQRLLVLVPQEPGVTNMKILDSDGNVIMQRDVIVGGAKQKYVRIRRSCGNSTDSSCAANTVYYCPDNACHQVKLVEEAQDSNQDMAPPTAGPSGPPPAGTQGIPPGAGGASATETP